MNVKSKETLISFNIFLHIFTRIACIPLITVCALVIEAYSTYEIVSSLVANMAARIY